jgi:predicted regulator of Ras-like GTPase activity (Roadblock/LC7/MglB family)
MQTTIERRRKRSEQVVEALSYQLSHVKEREQLKAFVLVDRDGLLVAAAPSEIDPEALSAICPLIHYGSASQEELAAVLGRHQKEAIVLQPLSIQGEQMFLFSIGEASQANRAVQDAESGVQRIFKMFAS